MLRNVASQKWRVYAWDTTNGQAKTGDAANISAYITIDDGTPAGTDDAAPTEADATNEPGYYDFDLTQAESNGAKLSLSPKSGTSDIQVVACPPVVYTRPQYFSLLGVESDGDLTKVNSLHGHTAQTGDSYAYLGTNLGALGANATEAGGTGDHLTVLATAAALATAQTDLDTIAGSDGVTLATTQGNYAPAKAGDNMGTVSAVTGGINTGAGTITTLDALDTAQDSQHSTTQGKVDTAQADLGILTGTDGVTIATTQPNYAPATAAALATAQTDLDTITGADGVTLATVQGNYAPAVAGDEMDLVDAPNATAVTAVQNGLSTVTISDINAQVVDVLRTDTIPDSYSADEAQPTIAQAILEIRQFLMERGVSGTTLTVNKPDGTTAAMTFTLNDGTSPTAITRAT